MTEDGTLTHDQKADFGEIYTSPDPRQYVRTLGALEYQIPCHAAPIFAAVLERSRRAGRYRRVLDVCCSYGVNAALLYSADTPSRTLAWYGDPATDELTPDQLAALDARRRRRNTDVTVLGLDASVPAIRYATRAGLIADGWAENLEDAEPSTALAGGIADVGMIISTGGFGYVTHRTFARLLRTIRAPEDLWLVIFVLRVFDYTDMITLLADYGLVTERIGDTFRQRRFATADERAAAIHDVRARGLDPTGKESDGWYHAECFLSRPATANR